jgi:hypothetical protein
MEEGSTIQWPWKNKRQYTNLQKTTQKITDRSTRTLLKPEVNSGASEGVAVPAPRVTATAKQHEHHIILKSRLTLE